MKHSSYCFGDGNALANTRQVPSQRVTFSKKLLAYLEIFRPPRARKLVSFHSRDNGWLLVLRNLSQYRARFVFNCVNCTGCWRHWSMHWPQAANRRYLCVTINVLTTLRATVYLLAVNWYVYLHMGWAWNRLCTSRVICMVLIGLRLLFFYLTIGSHVSVLSSRYEAHGKFGEHERCVRVALLASWVLSKLPKCFISRWTHSWRMNQLFYNIFNPMENFFSRGICFLTSRACTIGIWSTLAKLNLIRQIYKLCYNLCWEVRSSNSGKSVYHSLTHRLQFEVSSNKITIVSIWVHHWGQLKGWSTTNTNLANNIEMCFVRSL